MAAMIEKDDVDEVVRELDLYVTSEGSISLLQFPLKPVYSDPISVSAAKYKPRCKKVNIDIPFDNDVTFNAKENGADLPAYQTFESSIVANNVSLGVGVVRGNAMHITPVQNVWQMRPSFRSMARKTDTVCIDDDDDEYPEAEESKAAGEKDGLQQIQLKRKESERSASARAQSFTHLQAVEENEPWQELAVHDIGSDRSEEKFESLYYVADVAAV